MDRSAIDRRAPSRMPITNHRSPKVQAGRCLRRILTGPHIGMLEWDKPRGSGAGTEKYQGLLTIAPTAGAPVTRRRGRRNRLGRVVFFRSAGWEDATQDGPSCMRSTTLQNGWRESTEAPALGTGPLTWPGQRGPSWHTGRPASPPDGAGTAGPALDDASLVEHSKTDVEAFGELYDRYCDRIYRYVFRRLRNHEAAEDVTADIFLKVLRAIDTYRPATAPFSTWLYRIAANA